MALRPGQGEVVWPADNADSAGGVPGAGRTDKTPSAKTPSAKAPSSKAGSDRPPLFVGRDPELATLVGALVEPPALVLVEGEAGIGKTRLLRETLASPSLSDRTVLVAACPPLAEPFPLGPVVSGLRRLRDTVADVELSPLGGALRPLFPEWAHQLPPTLEPLDDPAETRHRLLRALTELVEQLGVDVLVVEDAHWADTATLEWLQMLTADELGAGPGGLSVVVTYRPDDVFEASPLLRVSSRAAGSVRVRLTPLSVAHARELVGSILGAAEVSEKFAGFLYARTDGVPLAVEETVRLLRDRDDIQRQDGAWARRVLEELEVPPTVRDSVLERVSRLTGEARHVLEAAALLAEPTDEATLVAVAGLDGDAGRAGVAAALGSGLLQETDPGRFVFRHVLDSEAVGEAILASERRRLHARAADVLQQWDPVPVVRLSRHFKEAGDTEQWCHYAEAAADLALEAGDDATTVAMLYELLTTIEHPPDGDARLARKLGQAAAAGVNPLVEGSSLIETLRRVVSRRDILEGQRGEIRLLLGRLLSGMDEPEAAAAEYQAAVAELGSRPALAVRAMHYLALPVVGDNTAEWHRSWLDRASELVPLVDSPTERLWHAAVRAMTLVMLGDEAGWRVAEDLPRSAAGQVEQQVIALAQLNLAQFAMAWGRFDDTRVWLSTGRGLAQMISYQRAFDLAQIAGAHLDWHTGNWDSLSGRVGKLSASQGARPATRLEARLVHGLLKLAGGERDAARSLLREVADGFARRGHSGPLTRPAASAALARLSLLNGDAREAFRVTLQIMEMIVQKQVWLWATDIAPVHLDALVALERVEEAEALVGQFGEGLAGRDAPAPAASLVLCRAIAAEARGDLPGADDMYAEAAQAWAALPRPYDELLTRERRGQCLLAAGEVDEGLQVLAGAQQRLYELGARWDADRVAHVLREHGWDVARAWRRGPKGYGNELSPRELDVVRLVARGMTNRQVAEALFLSPRTVDQHLRKAMRKLSVSSRTALVVAVADTGLLTDEVDDPVTHE